MWPTTFLKIELKPTRSPLSCCSLRALVFLSFLLQGRFFFRIHRRRSIRPLAVPYLRSCPAVFNQLPDRVHSASSSGMRELERPRLSLSLLAQRCLPWNDGPPCSVGTYALLPLQLFSKSQRLFGPQALHIRSLTYYRWAYFLGPSHRGGARPNEVACLAPNGLRAHSRR
jgi:hypothetical protein